MRLKLTTSTVSTHRPPPLSGIGRVACTCRTKPESARRCHRERDHVEHAIELARFVEKVVGAFCETGRAMRLTRIARDDDHERRGRERLQVRDEVERKPRAKMQIEHHYVQRVRREKRERL